MNIKILIPTFCCLFIFSSSFAQRQNVYFFKNSGKQVKSADSADYARIVSEPDSGSTFYNVKEYYKNGKVKMLGKSSTIDPIKLEDDCLTFYPNGKKKQYARYKEGQRDGDVYNYFPNGRIYSYLKYTSYTKKADQNQAHYTDFVILASADSTGKELVIDGNGHFIDYAEDFKTINEEGEIRSGLKNGIWKGITGGKKDSVTFTDVYDSGKFISGEAIDKDKKVYKYTVKMVEPKFIGGIDAFNDFLGHNIRYPEDARRDNITGKVIIQFVIEKDGSLVDAQVMRAPRQDLADEALRVIKKSPKWEAGIESGRPVRVSYTIPVNFTMNGGR